MNIFCCLLPVALNFLECSPEERNQTLEGAYPSGGGGGRQLAGAHTAHWPTVNIRPASEHNNANGPQVENRALRNTQTALEISISPSVLLVNAIIIVVGVISCKLGLCCACAIVSIKNHESISRQQFWRSAVPHKSLVLVQCPWCTNSISKIILSNSPSPSFAPLITK